MQVMENLGIKFDTVGGVKSPVTSCDPVNMTNTVELPESHHQFSDDRVHSGTESAAGDNGGFDSGGFEENSPARASSVVGKVRRGRRVGAGEIVDDLPEDDVKRSDVEAVRWPEKRVGVERIGASFETGEVVGEVRELADGYRREREGTF